MSKIKTIAFGGIGLALLAGSALADPMTTPSMSGPLAANPDPFKFDAGPFGPIYVTGAVTGLALWQDNPAPVDNSTWFDFTNAQVFVQKTDGWFQFFVQAGGYSLPSLGTPYFHATKITPNTYGWLPQAFVKIAPTDNFSIQVGKLPTLVGAETTFTFENMNIERGLLWNQEPAVSRGVQANYSTGPFAFSLSWNDGYYSNHYNWLSGSAAYTVDPQNTVSLVAAGNLARTVHTSFATPLAQNNSDIFNLIWTHTAAPWTIQPYLQFDVVPKDLHIGIAHEASTFGAGVLANYAFDQNWSLAGRVEYITSSGSLASGSSNLLYGPGSNAWSFTLTPTWQHGIFFARGEVSYLTAGSTTPGFALGVHFNDNNQTRGLVEAGVLF